MKTYTTSIMIGTAVTVTLTPKDSMENPPLPLSAPPDLNTNDPNGLIAAITHVSSDHLMFDIEAKGVGTMTITVDGQATPFPENLRAKTQIIVTVIGGPADHFDAAFSAPHPPQP